MVWKKSLIFGELIVGELGLGILGLINLLVFE